MTDSVSRYHNMAPESIWWNTLSIPLYLGGASCLSITCQAVYRHIHSRGRHRHMNPDVLSAGLLPKRSHIPDRTAYAITRLVGCLLLLALTIGIAITKPRNSKYTAIWMVSGITELYAVLLAFIALFTEARISENAIFHLNAVLFTSVGVYAYRDLWPLATFTKSPQDISNGWYLWAKIVVLAFVGLVIPLVMPTQYVPVNPKKPMAEPNSEQTASLFSKVTYTYLDPLILLARRHPSLTVDQLPALADSDCARHLVETSFPRLDPFSGGKQRHLFWALIDVYKRQVITLILLQLTQVSLTFAAPIGIYRLLEYLEHSGQGAIVRPWFWISWLFLGPFSRAIVQQRYTYIATRNMAQLQGIITQLLFAHSLRVRMDGGDEPEGGTNQSKSHHKNIVGRINNLATSDLESMTGVAEFWIVVMLSPIQIALSIIFLYAILSWSAVVGLAVMILCFPVPGYLTSKIRGVQATKMQKTDARVQKVTETLSILRMVKLLGWEPPLNKDISDKRKDEIKAVKKSKLLVLLIAHVNLLIPLCTMIATYGTYTAIMGRALTASTVFSSMAVFETLRLQLRMVIASMPNVVQGKVALDRVDDFLKHTSLLESLSTGRDITPNERIHSTVTGIRETEFSWSSSSNRCFKLRVKDELTFHPGFTLIVGPTGSGKTSLLMALLGEMQSNPIATDSWFNLSRDHGVAYAVQESWVQNDTIKNNIVFGANFDQERYNKVLYQCALLPDLALFQAGDNTEVGEKGLTLSGGQKARVTLARAIYSSARILLLDDTLAALDVHTAKWIVNKCFKGDIVHGRTVLLVTHNLALTAPISHRVVSLALDGTITQGTANEIMAGSDTLAAEAAEESESMERAEQDIDALAVDTKPDDQPSGKLSMAEEVEEGHVQSAAFKLYLGNLSRHPVLFWFGLMGALLLNDVSFIFQSWFLGVWATQYDNHPANEVSVSYYLSGYALLLLFSLLLYSAAFTIFTLGSLRSGKIIHKKLVDSVLGTTLRWLDTTPSSRIIARATMDMAAVDVQVSFSVWRFTDLNLELLAKFTAIIWLTPAFIIPGAMITMLGGVLGQLYMKTQLPVKRVMSNARSPVLGHFQAAIAGLTSIRAYGAQENFLEESLVRIDHYTRPTITFYNLNRWMTVRADALAGLFTASLGAYLIYGPGTQSSASTGFSLNMAAVFSSMILTWVRILNGLELYANNLERILHYINIEQEPKPKKTGIPPAYWPATGSIRADNLCAKYSADGPEVLSNISFEIKSGEHIGIVGRTGSGKSSLTLSLLRCIPTEGEVFYDGIPTSSLNLDALRSKITIIPQVPDLLSGTLRDNLDPFSEYDDIVLNDALRSAGLYSLQSEGETNKITLDTVITRSGSNMSVGQRQIIALARAIVRRSKLLILDEATSAIDYKTDSVIQQSLRRELGEVTLITVAHRLQTIMDFDRIMVLDKGRIVEFDAPSVLLKDKDGFLRALVDESSDRGILYAMVKGSHSDDLGDR